MRKLTEEQLARVRLGLPAFSVRGERNPNAKLTPEKVRAIRHGYNVEERTLASIAAEYRVVVGTVHDIVAKRTWRYV